MLIKIEMAVKSDAEELDMVLLARGTDVPAISMQSDWSRGLVPKHIASVLFGFKTKRL